MSDPDVTDGWYVLQGKKKKASLQVSHHSRVSVSPNADEQEMEKIETNLSLSMGVYVEA